MCTLYLIALVFLCVSQPLSASRILSLQPERPTADSQMNMSCAVSGGLNYSTDVMFFPANKLGQCGMAILNSNQCIYDSSCPYTASCDVTGSQFILSIDSVPDTWHGINIYCSDSFGGDVSNTISLFVQVPVTSSSILPSSTVNITENEDLNVTCQTDTCRPAANITWYKDNAIISSNIVQHHSIVGDKFITTSTLTLTGQRQDLNKKIHCEASNIPGLTSVKSAGISVNVFYAPRGVPGIFPTGTLTYNDTNTVTLTCKLTEDGNPPSVWLWKCNNQPMSQGQIMTIQNGSRLMFPATKDRNGHGCYCRASSPFGTFNQTSSSVSLNIQYPAMIQNITINGGSGHRFMENTPLSVNCKVDSNPLAITQIINMDNGTIFETQNAIWNIPKADCLDTAMYKCETSNGHGIPESKSFNLFVLCSPRQDPRVHLPPLIGVPEGRILSLSAQIISYPLPLEGDVKWIFRVNETSINSTIVDDNSTNINITRSDLDKNVCNISLTKQFQKTKQDYGEYVVEIKNNIGRGEIVFRIFPVGKPNPPSNVSLKCTNSLATISWTSNFDGGTTQLFYVKYKREEDMSFIVYPQVYPDTGEGQVLKALIPGIHPSIIYNFKIFANNSYGTSENQEYKNCVLPAENESNLCSCTTQVAGAIGGTASALIMVLITTILGVVLKRRYLNVSKDTGSREQQQRVENEKYEDIQSDNPSPILEDPTVSGSNYEQLQDSASEVHAYDVIEKSKEYINLELR